MQNLSAVARGDLEVRQILDKKPEEVNAVSRKPKRDQNVVLQAQSDYLDITDLLY